MQLTLNWRGKIKDFSVWWNAYYSLYHRFSVCCWQKSSVDTPLQGTSNDKYQIHIQSIYKHSHCKRLGIHLECALQWISPESCTSRLVCIKNYTWRAYYRDWKRQDAKSVIETGGKQSKKRLVESVHKHIRILSGVVTVSLVCTLSNTWSNIYLAFPTSFYLP